MTGHDDACSPVEYDVIAKEYQACKLAPWRQYVEKYLLESLLEECGAFTPGCAVLDLACGEGIWSRWLKEKGAGLVTGVDLSSEMIKLARDAESADAKGIDYIVGDGRALELGPEHLGRYDVILAAWLFNYSECEADLRGFAETCHKYLRPGGVIVGINNNPDQAVGSFDSHGQYGFRKVAPSGGPQQHAGDKIVWKFNNPLQEGAEEFQIVNFFLPIDMHQRCFREVGFSQLQWEVPRVSPQGQASFPKGFWDALVHDPPFKGIVATKQSRVAESCACAN